MSKEPFLLSLFDYTGAWAKPFADAGWKVLLWDKKVEGCVLERFGWIQALVEEEVGKRRVDGILAAPPCTAFAGSGARWWPDKDQEGTGEFPFDSFTEQHKALILIVLHAVDLFRPRFWALENPVGRIERLIPELRSYRKMTFNPCDFGDPYTKRTILYGEFNTDLKKSPVEPTEGSKMLNFSPGSDRPALRSVTPPGFAKAFFDANHDWTNPQLNLFQEAG